jgi:hypothetical protein
MVVDDFASTVLSKWKVATADMWWELTSMEEFVCCGWWDELRAMLDTVYQPMGWEGGLFRANHQKSGKCQLMGVGHRTYEHLSLDLW